MNKNFNIGNVVQSMAGHDKGKYFVVLAIDGGYAQIANGKLHKVDKPKKKKLKHLKDTGCTYEELAGVQFEIEKITNPKLRKTITAFKKRDLN